MRKEVPSGAAIEEGKKKNRLYELSQPSLSPSVIVQPVVGDEVQWYSVPLSVNRHDKKQQTRSSHHRCRHHHKNHRKTPNVVLAPFYLENIPQFSGVAVLGSSIYIAGGFPDTFPSKPPPTGDIWYPLCDVLTVDTTRLSHDDDAPSSWNVIKPPLRNARFLPLVVSVDGILYVMGGLDEFGDPETWAEAFDPELRKWVSIPQPPSPLPRDFGSFAVALRDEHRFLVGSCQDDFFYLYDVDAKKWSRLDHYLGPSSGSLSYGPSTVQWFRYGLVHAYYLFRKRFYSVSIGGIHDYVRASLLTDSNDCYQLLVGIGGNKLCLVCVAPYQSLLHCVEFRVDDEPCFHGNKASLNAAVESSNAYCISRSQMILSAMFMQLHIFNLLNSC